MTNWQKLLNKLDPVNQLAAVTDNRTTVVSAGAGSGKTRVLSVRYLYLIKERKISPKRILCMTFTNKAAAEMSDRIYSMLSDCAKDDNDFAAALEEFPLSRVSTLDSFCSELARSTSNRWGIAPDFSIDKNPGGQAAKNLALNYLLEQRTDNGAKAFIIANGFEKAVNALSAFTQRREGIFASDDEFNIDLQNKAILPFLTEKHAELFSIMDAGKDMSPGDSNTSWPWLKMAKSIQEALPAALNEEALLELDKYYKELSGLHLPRGKSIAAVYYGDYGKTARVLAAICSLAANALLNKERKHFLNFLKAYLKMATEFKATSKSLSFNDIAAMAMLALETDYTIRDWYKSRYDAIMVDEFQDNNEVQKRILYCLAERRIITDADRKKQNKGRPGPEDLEPGVLFFVGDEKQSIYAYRGADVRVFRGLSKELSVNKNSFGEHKLSKNWRSEPDLIDFFNKTFSAILPAPDYPDANDYEARFEGLEAGPACQGVNTEIVYHEATEQRNPEYLPSDETEAWYIANLIAELVKKKTKIATQGDTGTKEAGACTYDDIAVLFRSTRNQNRLERYLRLLSIPYTSLSTAGLFVESITADIYNMLRLAVFPGDSMAFASALRGPLARLSDDGIFMLLSQENRKEAEQSPEGLFALPSSCLDEEDRARLEALKESWLNIRNMADKEPIAKLVEYLWYDRGLRWNILQDPSASSFLEHFDYLWAGAAASDAKGERLVDFVSLLEEKMGQVERHDEASPKESSVGVKLLTIHTSKGLEYPVVIIPDLDSGSKEEQRSPISNSKRFGISAKLWQGQNNYSQGNNAESIKTMTIDHLDELDRALSKFERGNDDREMDESTAEIIRLFYVACTRAISSLHFVGKVPYNEDSRGRSFRGLLLKAWPWLGPPEEASIGMDVNRPGDAPAYLKIKKIDARKEEELLKLISGKKSAEHAVHRAQSSATAGELIEIAPKSYWAVTEAQAFLKENAILPEFFHPEPALEASVEEESLDMGLSPEDFGSLCHAFIEHLFLTPLKEVDQNPKIAKLLAVLSKSQRLASLEHAKALAIKFMESELGQKAVMALNAKKSKNPMAVFELEYPFVWQAEQNYPVLAGSIDLLFSTGTELSLVDFKTDAKIESKKHDFQLSVYSCAAAELFGKTAHAYVFYLKHGQASIVQANFKPSILLNLK